MSEHFFTLSASQGGPGYVSITASSWTRAREIMFGIYNGKWAFQYDSIDQIHSNDQLCLLKIVEKRKPKDGSRTA